MKTHLIPMLHSEPIMTTTDVCQTLGFTVSANLLKSLGTKPIAITRNATYWRAADFPAICHSLARRLEKLAESTCAAAISA
ncbi:hypothetical protein [Burkholderia cenocepacia]|uniref:hypothetical protein n=1 Tax=Burkholderia cenocepacia TaxID=95486 RepID=UPI0013E0C939|nr:hypothetical protein [Burkholderia cenocepacia]MCW3583978.1 hypothetical protein [Burkholderia cenocepacia]MCW3629583.1 hypothetical protein [Burkholderia cenocepacia]MCW5182611.1 hypothetical protein [Burkholderia cenocepacia]NGO98948.1 hypothetical protein [Burkholderia cenocepacia]